MSISLKDYNSGQECARDVLFLNAQKLMRAGFNDPTGRIWFDFSEFRRKVTDLHV